MKRTSSALIPIIAINRGSRSPLHRQIYDAFRAAILRGELRSGQQVPSTRLLARELGLSRIPAISAYEELLAEGYFESRTGAGTFVSASLPENLTLCETDATNAARTRAGSRSLSRRSRSISLIDKVPWRLGPGAFSVGQSAFEQFPVQVWSRLVARYARSLRSTSLQYGTTAGLKSLRQALAVYLGSSRAVRCDAEQIIIVSGSQQALQLTAMALLDAGDRVWMEDPGYWLAQRAFALAGCRIVPVPVDSDGIDVAAGIKRCRKARMAFVTPSHQFPLGATMSLPRRLQLLDWARSAGAWIVEDDYDSEYRYESRPIASLQGLDSEDRVIYVGTFSKVLFPSIRCGYMVVPRDLVDRFLAVRQTMDVGPPDMNQSILAQFIDDGHFARHIRRMRVLYGERREALGSSLDQVFGGELEVLGDRSGMHLSVVLPKGFRDEEIAMRAAQQRLWLWPLSPSYLGDEPKQGFMLGFGGVPLREISRSVHLLGDLINPK